MEGKRGRDGRPNGGNGGAGKGHPKVVWADAFNFYAALPVNERSYALVAERFGVSHAEVCRRGAPRNGAWAEKAKALDRMVAEKAQSLNVRDRVKRTAAVLRLADTATIRALRDLRAGKLDAKLADIPGLVKLAELLEGEATDRVDFGEVKAEIDRVIAAAVRHMKPAERDAFLADLEDDEGTAGVLAKV